MTSDNLIDYQEIWKPTFYHLHNTLDPPNPPLRGINTGAITTLGRGGSDLSATVLGAALELDEVQVWKDVDGGWDLCGRKGGKGVGARGQAIREACSSRCGGVGPSSLFPLFPPPHPAGVLTTDPRLVPNTRPVNRLTFEEATELAYFGAQVLHPQAMQPAIRSGKMNVRVKNSYNR